MIDPLAAMQAACIAVANGDAGEIELEFSMSGPDDVDHRLNIIVRRDTVPLTLLPSPEQ